MPLLLNTSFNVQEPIVLSPQDAINTFTRASFDALVLKTISSCGPELIIGMQCERRQMKILLLIAYLIVCAVIIRRCLR